MVYEDSQTPINESPFSSVFNRLSKVRGQQGSQTSPSCGWWILRGNFSQPSPRSALGCTKNTSTITDSCVSVKTALLPLPLSKGEASPLSETNQFQPPVSVIFSFWSWSSTHGCRWGKSRTSCFVITVGFLDRNTAPAAANKRYLNSFWVRTLVGSIRFLSCWITTTCSSCLVKTESDVNL